MGLDAWREFGGDAAATLLALLLALGMARLGSLQYRLLAPEDGEAVPLLHVLAAATGGLAALALLLAVPHGSAFAPPSLFAAAGPWDIPLGQFLHRHALPRPATLRGLLAALGGGGGPLRGAVAWLAAGGFLLGPLLALRLWRGRDRLRALGGFLLLALWTALILHYAVHLAAWTLAQLHPWSFALGLLLFQRWRHRRAAHQARGSRAAHQDTCISAK